MGALRGIIKQAVQRNSDADRNFFNFITGSSAGAINDAILVQEFIKVDHGEVLDKAACHRLICGQYPGFF